MRRILSVIVLTAFVFGTIVPMPVRAQEASDLVNLVTGDLETVDVKNLSRVSVTNPEVADISDAQADKVTIVGKKAGQTTIFLWDESGKRIIDVRVASEDLRIVKSRLEEVLSKAQLKGVAIDANAYEGKVVLSGSVTKEDKDTLIKVLEPYSDKVINLVKEAVSDDLIQIDMQITELSTTLSKNVGFEWGSGTSDSVALSYNETLPTATGKPKDFFKIGDFNRTTALVATVNALVEQGKGRILSKPRLVVVSGKEASFLVGGEIPIRTTTTNATGGSTQQNVQFKQYGVNMTITPKVRNGKVDVLLNVQISDVDRANAVGDDVAFLTRQAQTQLFLDDKQTIVLAGLIKRADGETVKKIPFLGSIPVVGLLFRNRSTPTANSDTELVITLTPTILRDKQYAKQETVIPSPEARAFTKEVEAPYEHKVLGSSLTPVIADKPQAVVTPSAVPMVTEAVVPAEPLTPYARSIQEKISKAISYPYEALENDWSGTVKLRLQILKDGTLAAATVIESSGHDVFDQDALNTAKIVAPYGPFPTDSENSDLTVTLPIVYNQSNSAKDQSATTVAAY